MDRNCKLCSQCKNGIESLVGVSYDPDLAAGYDVAYINLSMDSPIGYPSVEIDGQVLHFVKHGEATYYIYMDGLNPNRKNTFFGKEVYFSDYTIYGDFNMRIPVEVEVTPWLWYYDHATNSISLCFNGTRLNKYVFKQAIFTNVPITDVFFSVIIIPIFKIKV